MLFLVFFDMILAAVALFSPVFFLSIFKLNADIPGAVYRAGAIEPIFVRGVAILWALAAYVQYLAWKDPVGRPLVLNIALVFRFCGGTIELIESLFLLPAAGYSYIIGYITLAVFYIGDYLLIGWMIYLANRCGIKWRHI